MDLLLKCKQVQLKRLKIQPEEGLVSLLLLFKIYFKGIKKFGGSEVFP